MDNQTKTNVFIIFSRSVLISDINPRMLEVGKKRAEGVLTKDERSRVDWLEADAENLSTIPDNAFDVYTIAFGIRNCVHVDKVRTQICTETECLNITYLGISTILNF